MAHVSAGAAQDKPYGVRGTLVTVDDQLLTLMNDDEETFEVALTEDTGAFAVTPAKWSDIRPGQFVGITSGGIGRTAGRARGPHFRRGSARHWRRSLSLGSDRAAEHDDQRQRGGSRGGELCRAAKLRLTYKERRGRGRGPGRAGHHGAEFRRGRAPREERGPWPVRARQGRVRARPGQRARSPGRGRGRGRRRGRDSSNVRRASSSFWL